ncbi:MAG: hypothetical protein HC924_12135 [Synechococcaceae cyanobacterium SM2_3_2]|nr:hypothetical protein [Synechococcaceae cyanobacterium SM2_3_2]
MRRIHLAIAVTDLQASISDYSARLGMDPEVVIPGEYALWRTDSVNLSIRYTEEDPGTLRHLGWEDDEASQHTTDIDCNGIVWEHFSAHHQAEEIRALWS